VHKKLFNRCTKISEMIREMSHVDRWDVTNVSITWPLRSHQDYCLVSMQFRASTSTLL